MSLYVKGDNIANATSYALKNKQGTLETKNSINFNLDTLSLSEGVNELTVHATASGYTDSDDSNTEYVLNAPLKPDEINLQTYFNYSAADGSIISAGTTHHAIYIYENLTPGRTIRVTGYVPGLATMFILGYYNTDGTFIKYEDKATTFGASKDYDVELTLPSDCSIIKVLRYGPTADSIKETYVYSGVIAINIIVPSNTFVGVLRSSGAIDTSNAHQLLEYTNWNEATTLYCSGYRQSTSYLHIGFFDESDNFISGPANLDEFAVSSVYTDIAITIPEGTAKIRQLNYNGIENDTSTVTGYLYTKA